MKKYLSILAFSCLTLCSCDNFLDLTPQSVLTPENAYEKPEDWQQTLYAAYGTLQEVFVGKYTITLTEFGTDEVIPFDMGWAAYSQLHYYTFSASHEFLDNHYRLCYEGIKRCNAVIDMPSDAVSAEDAVKTAENLVAAQPDLDFVFFDLPGTINNADVVQTISQMDYIFTPIIADRVVMESSIKFATVINEQMISTGKSGIKGIYLVWNMVDGREKTELYKAYDKVCAEFALPILETHLPDSKRFRKETAAERKAVFRSTAFPADKILVRGSNLDKLVDEILGIIKN